MKKTIMIICMLMTLFTTNMLAQEKARGIETRVVKIDDYYYGVEFANRNTIPVSITMELWCLGNSDDNYKERLEQTKDIVLQPNEKYVWRIQVHKEADGRLYKNYHYHYYKHEAYKLQ